VLVTTYTKQAEGEVDTDGPITNTVPSIPSFFNTLLSEKGLPELN